MRELRFSAREATISISEVPVEILSNILSRLSVRSLLSCQCVCKRFLALIRQPKFIASHLNSSTHTTTFCSVYIRILDENHRNRIDHILVEDSSVCSVSYVRQSNPITSHISIIGSCNGLFCADLRTPGEQYGSFILLWNPVTRQNRYLPKPQIDAAGRALQHVLAFGFVPETNDYKIVRIVDYYSSGNSFPSPDDVYVMQMEVYKMSTDSWTTFETATLPCYGPNNVSLEINSFSPLHIYDNYNTVSLKGAFHWVADNPINVDETNIAIVSFDLKDEKLKVFTVLDSHRIPFVEKGKLLILNESLSLIVTHRSEIDSGFDIWVMNDYGNQDSWTKQFSVEQIPGLAWPLGYWKDDLLLMFEFLHNKRRLFFYNLSTQDRKNLPDLGCLYFFTFCPYVETLVPVTLGNAVAEDDDQ